MIIITNNQGGEDKLTVSKGAYETFYKRLGYSIIQEEKKKEVFTKKVDTSKDKSKEEEKVSKSKKTQD